MHKTHIHRQPCGLFTHNITDTQQHDLPTQYTLSVRVTHSSFALSASTLCDHSRQFVVSFVGRSTYFIIFVAFVTSPLWIVVVVCSLADVHKWLPFEYRDKFIFSLSVLVFGLSHPEVCETTRKYNKYQQQKIFFTNKSNAQWICVRLVIVHCFLWLEKRNIVDRMLASLCCAETY